MQSGIGVSKILVLAGAGYTTTVLFQNGRLSDLLGELQKTRKQLRQRVQNLDDKVLEQNKLSRELKNDVAGVHKSVDAIESNVSELRHSLYNLGDKLGSLEYKQHIANEGLVYLYNFLIGNKVKMPEVLQRQLKGSAKPCGLLTYPETPSLKDFKALVESLFVDTKSAGDAMEQNCINMLVETPK